MNRWNTFVKVFLVWKKGWKLLNLPVLMKQNRIKMPQLQFVSIVLLRSGFIPFNNLKSGRTFVNTVKTSWKFIKNQNEIDVDSILIHLFYQKSNYFISTRGKRARRKKRVHQTPKISKNFTQEKYTSPIWKIQPDLTCLLNEKINNA